MSARSDTVLKKREHELKLIEAWSAGRYKIATLALVGNGAALATALSFIREKGQDPASVFVYKASSLGLVLGAIAILVTWIAADSAIGRSIKPTDQNHPEALSPLAHWLTFLIFVALIAGSAGSFAVGLGFFEGWSDATINIQNGLVRPK